MKKLIFLSLLILAGCKESSRIDLSKVASSKTEAFKYVKYRPGKMDYTYCDSSSDITDLIKEEKRVIVVCLAIDHVSPRSGEKNRFFKYSSINEYGKINFCGWRDNYMRIDKKGKIISNTPKSGVSGKCESFSIYKYHHT
ncbi:hypothetical protein [Aliivibrio fischeri]|uniref:Putative lipoprotein n=2 Tax=Aliivibrio TaxID=511678 RepID=A0A090I771_9GAMM|nr:hypothetical protein [Aliivibrio fischeri]OCH13576.1 hypothetical protein A6E03_18365 [Aliivibrio sp. 1S128]CED57386.1 putative lipoprotein [Aliivibrio wodanis]MCE7557183.1 hypothetical protein [Aliivibrio fischeri]MCE7562971.1 hypothetical protein [Aliivibrio fischeri]MCE7571861.1 hypothetical protein [Aliivibrio fischeri]